MSQFVKSFTKTLVAAADLSASIGYIVKLDTNGDVVLAAAATDNIIGVVENNDGASGAGVVYQFLGTVKVKLGGTVSIGAWVTADSAGKGVATTTDKDVAIGRALEAGVSGDLIEVQLGIHKLSI
jgi:hypothetical protein